MYYSIVMPFRRGEIEVLAVDDQKDILDLSELFLERFEDDLNVETTVDPEEDPGFVVEGELDAIVSDYNMPAMNGLELLEEVREIDDSLPFILYTGKGSEEVAAEAVNLGVTDYFRKEAGSDHYQMIAARLVDAVDSYRSAKEREVYESIVENSENPILVTDSESNILYVNEAFEDITGYSEEEVLGENPNILNSDFHTDDVFSDMYASLRAGEIFEIEEMRNVDRNGDEYIHDQHLIPVSISGETPEFYAAISDVKEA